MAENPEESLPLPQRLALSYASRRSRDSVLTLFLLDERLASILRQRGEKIIAQMKLAWWRDRLAEDPHEWPAGEPLLARLRDGRVDPSRYGPLVDGWERLLGEHLTLSAIEEFAGGRALAWRALAEACDVERDLATVERAAREWTFADLALHLDDAEEARAARQLARPLKWSKPRLPRAVRPLVVLHALAGRALINGSGELLDGPRAALVALRIGLTGR